MHDEDRPSLAFGTPVQTEVADIDLVVNISHLKLLNVCCNLFGTFEVSYIHAVLNLIYDWIHQLHM